MPEHPHLSSHDITSPAPLELNDHAALQGWIPRISLFWRTFCLLALLQVGCMVAWFQTLKSLELEPQAIYAARQMALVAHLSHEALQLTQGPARERYILALAQDEGLKIVTRRPSDTFEKLSLDDPLGRHLTQEITRQLGQGTVVAGMVNQQPGLWISLDLDGQRHWLSVDMTQLVPTDSLAWPTWLGIAALLSLLGSTLIARLVNKPLQQLSMAAAQVKEGNFSRSFLDENMSTPEIRDVNIGFNRMAQQLAAVEQNRAIMLAGISHDLRTPLARLRLETEMSVQDPEARDLMAADIAQLDGIIDKFLDYARPHSVKLQAVALGKVIESCIFPHRETRHLKINLSLENGLHVLADEVELGRVITNLLENALRYGKTPGSDNVEIDIAAKARDEWVLLKVRDHGRGVPPDNLADLTKPFFRGDSARTHASGAGLGLSIVKRTVHRMGGRFVLANTSSGGLAAHIKLLRA